MTKPKVNTWATWIFALQALVFLALIAWAIKDGWFPSERVLLKHPDPTDPFYAFNKTLPIMMLPFFLISIFPACLMFSKKRAPWVWITLLVFICLNLFSSLLAYIPLLIFWVKENNRDFYNLRHWS